MQYGATELRAVLGPIILAPARQQNTHRLQLNQPGTTGKADKHK